MISIVDLFKIGIGPSSSHTVGPMRAAAAFVRTLAVARPCVARIRVRLYGSLAWTGRGHGTDLAVLAGLSGSSPESVDPADVRGALVHVRACGVLPVPGIGNIAFDPDADIVFDLDTSIPQHPNAMRFEALDSSGGVVAAELWFSVGGGFVVRDGDQPPSDDAEAHVPYPFRSAVDLLARCAASGHSIAGVQYANELAMRPQEAVERHAARVVETMFEAIARGMAAEGPLPGGLHVARRAKSLAVRLCRNGNGGLGRAHDLIQQVSLYAIAVNEENAAGGRVVTAPTNGAAGVVPAVLAYYKNFCPGYSGDQARDFLLTATAIAALYKLNASISGAEVGCQGEVGVASSMAAAALCAVLGGSPAQVENAAEIAMEHHLGMTCDPVGGLVQIPCIERNAFGAVKAITAATLALSGDGSHRVTLDQVIATMRQTGADMGTKYKETSRGGLAVNVAEC